MNEMKVWNFVDPTPEDGGVLANFRENPPDVYGFGHVAYLHHVVDAVVNDSPSLVDGLEGRKSLELISAIYESIETAAKSRCAARRTDAASESADRGMHAWHL